MNPQILILDHDNARKELFQELLEEQGYRAVHRATRGLDVDAIARLQPDIILMELLFHAEQESLQRLAALREHERTCRTPIIVSTTEPHIAPALQELRAVMLLEPFEYDEFQEALHMAQHAFCDHDGEGR